MFKELLEAEIQFTDYAAFPTAADRALWSSVPSDYARLLIRHGEEYLGYSFPAIPATVFMSFLRTGNRTDFEDLNFSKRYALNALIIAECVEYRGRFLDDIINGIFSICEESAWQLPPHNSYPGMPNQLLPDVTAPVLDLFACETGALLATAYYLLKDSFDLVHPFINKRILHEIDTRIITPYINEHFWWMGNGHDKMCNWTVWCTQNVLITAFLSAQSDEARHAVFEKACLSADDFLKDYGEDGCCDEGAQYYRHAALCLFNSIEIINAVTAGSAMQLYRHDKIRNMALYILNVHVNDIYYINFADCSPVAGRAGAREFLFGKRIESPAMQSFAAKEFRASDDRLLSNEINLFYRLQNVFTASEMLAYPDIKTEYSDIYYESVGLFAARDDSLCVAAKAGCNADSHNHNDTGSFTIYKGGLPFLIDVGVETYTKKTFSPERYELWPMQSAYHNLPTINGVQQRDGADYRAVGVSHSFTEACASISMNIARAYPPEAGIDNYYRTVTLYRGREITVRDSFSFTPGMPAAVVLSLMTYDRPSVDGNTVNVGALGKIIIDGASAITAEEIPINDKRLGIAWKHSIYRILVTADSAMTAVTMHFW